LAGGDVSPGVPVEGGEVWLGPERGKRMHGPHSVLWIGDRHVWIDVYGARMHGPHAALWIVYRCPATPVCCNRPSVTFDASRGTPPKRREGGREGRWKRGKVEEREGGREGGHVECEVYGKAGVWREREQMIK